MIRVVLATANRDKAAEIGAVLSGLELVPRPEWVPEIDEVGATLEDNARLKARAVTEATGEVALADDTGLEVEALDGGPGVRTARFAGEEASYADNVDKLVRSLEGVGNRRARFRTIALATFPDGGELVAEGAVEGRIAEQPRGSGGFGYDPVFVPVGGGGLTFAEMSPASKNALSHRGRAFRRLSELLGS